MCDGVRQKLGHTNVHACIHTYCIGIFLSLSVKIWGLNRHESLGDQFNDSRYQKIVPNVSNSKVEIEYRGTFFNNKNV